MQNFKVKQMDQPSLHVQLGTTMSLQAAVPPASPLSPAGPYSPSQQASRFNPKYNTQYSPLHTAQFSTQPSGQQTGQHTSSSSNIYSQLPSFSMPITGSSTLNISLPPAPPNPTGVSRGTETYTTRIPIGSPPKTAPTHHPVTSPGSNTSHMGVQTGPLASSDSPSFTSVQIPPQTKSLGTQVFVGPETPETPQTHAQNPKSKSSRMRNGSTHSSAGSSVSSGLGSTPSSPLMTSSSDPSGALSQMKLRQGEQEAEVDAESLTWSSLDDTRSERSYNSSGTGSAECDSACSVGSPGEDKEEVPGYDRVGIVCDERKAVMVQLACESDEGTSHEKFIDLAAGVAAACGQYFGKKEAERETMNSTQLSQIIMADRRPVRDHVAEVSEILGENVTTTRADCRRVNSRGYVSTYVLDDVTYKNKSTVSKHGVIVVLRKLNKFACCKEFAEQLCLHILATKPESLGKGELSTTIETRRKPVNRKHLLTQRFYCDQSCNVYEAGKRSFVEILDFVLY